MKRASAAMKTLKTLAKIGTVCLVGMGFNTVWAAGQSSANYAIPWDVAAGGGGISSSTSYDLEDSVGQSSALGQSTSPNYVLYAGFQSIPNDDHDRIRNNFDNCILKDNEDQRDTDADGYGNICDPDFDNNGFINASDLAYLKLHFFTSDPDADLDGNGFVNAADLAILKQMFFGPPGPSGLAP